MGVDGADDVFVYLLIAVVIDEITVFVLTRKSVGVVVVAVIASALTADEAIAVFIASWVDGIRFWF